MLLPLACALVLAAAPIRLSDDVGRTVVLSGPARRIVSTAPANTEVLYALGAGAQVVGDTTFCDYPEAARALPKVGDFATIDVEKVLALEPDLVVATWSPQKRWVAALESRGLKVLVIYPRGLEGVAASLQLVGRATGHEAEAAKLVADMKQRLAVVDKEVAAVSEAARPRVFVLITTNPLFTVGPGSSLDEVVRRAGGRNIFADLKSPYADVAAEAVVARDPDLILVAEAVKPGEGLKLAAAVPGLGATRAVKQARVVDTIDPALLVHPNHRLVDGIEALHSAFAALGR